MSFSDPAWLLALALIPLAVLAYVAARRRSNRYVVRFPAAATAALAVAGSASSWRRHLPAVFALAALAALAFALARPHVSYSQPVEQASLMLVIDHSGSMASNDVAPTRLQAVQRAANTFIDQLPSNAKVGVVGFGTTPDVVTAPVTNHNAARNAINGVQAGGSTATGNALEVALQLLHATDSKHPPSAIVLLSDGAANAGINPITEAQQAKADRIPIYTVALGTPNGTLQNPDPFGQPIPVPPDPQLMAQIAAASGARSYTVQNADLLNSIYAHLGRQLGSVERKHEVTAEFAAGGLVLLLLAALGSARWTGRLP
ncbi:MAG TPA: VWA domain-containing protein [Solirubrobacteraceae bacterium]|nr:VWA domain-containing protein [Solirubrobacteraceae bacterium]